jgi:hypothetical protein
MSRDEEIAVIAAWRAFTAGRVVERRTYLEFIDVRIRAQPGLRRLSVFEVLDVVVNADPPPENRASA